MAENIKVSVIIPIYGVEKFIERCARSLFSQTLQEIEFIFVNDCTRDSSMTVLESVIKDYPERKSQVIILKHEQNKGLPQARKTGILVAKGEYIAHCDSDDWVDVNMYQHMYDYAKSNDLDIVYCDFYRSEGQTNEYGRILENNVFMSGPVWNKIVRKELYNDAIEYPVANKAEDGALMIQLSFFAKNRGYLQEPLYYYFQNPDSICRVPTKEACLKRLQEECDNTDLRIRFLENRGIAEKYDCEIIRWKYVCRKNILPLIKEKEYLKLWKNTYPEINKQIILKRSLSLKWKVVFVIIYLGLFPLFDEKLKKYY